MPFLPPNQQRQSTAGNTRGNKYKLLNHTFHSDLRKHSFSAHIVNIWNSLPNSVVDVDSVSLFKACLDKFWMHQEVKHDSTANLTGIGDRPVHEISGLLFLLYSND